MACRNRTRISSETWPPVHCRASMPGLDRAPAPSGRPAGMFAANPPLRSQVDRPYAWPGCSPDRKRPHGTRQAVGTRALTGSLRLNSSPSNLGGYHLPVVPGPNIDVSVAAHARRPVYSSKQSGGLHQSGFAVNSYSHVFQLVIGEIRPARSVLQKCLFVKDGSLG